MASDAALTSLDVLAIVAPEDPLPGLLRARGARVSIADGPLDEIVRSAHGRPDVVVLFAGAPGLSALDVCRALHADPAVGATVPILVLVRGRPTPAERVAAVRAGVWELVTYAGPRDLDDLWLKLETYAQARHTIAEAIADGLADPVTGVLNGPGLVRRGRELVSLMARERAPLACVVFALPGAAGSTSAGALVARASRISDIVGVLDAGRCAVLAPSTDEAGVVKLVERVRAAMRGAGLANGEQVEAPDLRVGYHVVGNVGYQPTDSVELLRRATTALDAGVPDPAHPWMRRYEETWR